MYVDCGKKGAGVRKVKIKSQMLHWRVVVRPFDAVAVARLFDEATVPPVSPSCCSSDWLWRYQSETVLCRWGKAEVRTPISAPLVWTRAGILEVAVGNGLSGEIGSSFALRHARRCCEN
jgi:hypothetical protein